MSNAKPEIRIRPITAHASSLSTCRTGQYVRFAEPDRLSRARWSMGDAYQYLGTVGRTKYAKVLHVTSRLIRQVPRTSQVTRLKVVSIELEVDAARNDYDD